MVKVKMTLTDTGDHRWRTKVIKYEQMVIYRRLFKVVNRFGSLFTIILDMHKSSLVPIYNKKNLMTEAFLTLTLNQIHMSKSNTSRPLGHRGPVPISPRKVGPWCPRCSEWVKCHRRGGICVLWMFLVLSLQLYPNFHIWKRFVWFPE